MTQLTPSQVRARETGMFLQSLFGLGILGVAIYNHPIILAYMAAAFAWFYVSGLTLRWFLERSYYDTSGVWWKVAMTAWLFSPLLVFAWGPIVLLIFGASLLTVLGALAFCLIMP